MNFIRKPSLETTTLFKLATILWDQHDIRTKITEFFILNDKQRNMKRWVAIEQKVKEKVTDLTITELLKRELSSIIKEAGLKILYFMEYNKMGGHPIPLPQEIFWTSQGTIDHKKTIEMLLTDQTLNLNLRYKLSCAYSLEHKIREFYSLIDQNYMKKIERCVTAGQLSVWAKYLNGKFPLMERPYEYMHMLIDVMMGTLNESEGSLYDFNFFYGYSQSAEYFMKKLPPNEKTVFHVDLCEFLSRKPIQICKYSRYEFIKNYACELLCVFLSEMNSEQQRELFRRAPVAVLTCFLEWPYEVFFMKTINEMRSFLSPEMYKVIFKNLLKKIENGHKYFNYSEIFSENWQLSPNASKRYIWNTDSYSYKVIVKLFKTSQKANVKLVFNDATVDEKNKLLYSFGGQEIFKKLIESQEWEFLNFYIKSCIESRSEIYIFKKHAQDVIQNRWSKGDIRKNQQNLMKFYKLLDDIICGINKRNYVDETDINEAKRRRCYLPVYI